MPFQSGAAGVRKYRGFVDYLSKFLSRLSDVLEPSQDTPATEGAGNHVQTTRSGRHVKRPALSNQGFDLIEELDSNKYYTFTCSLLSSCTFVFELFSWFARKLSDLRH